MKIARQIVALECRKLQLTRASLSLYDAVKTLDAVMLDIADLDVVDIRALELARKATETAKLWVDTVRGLK